jgi:hypothetical protein
MRASPTSTSHDPATFNLQFFITPAPQKKFYFFTQNSFRPKNLRRKITAGMEF